MNRLFANVEIKGSLKFSQQLLLEGRIEGDVTSNGHLVIGEKAVVKGTVQTGSALVFGSVEGDIIVQDRCEVKTTAIVVGNISAKTLSIEEGATFSGRASVTQTSKPAEKSHDRRNAT
ncbi:MAG: polymer-forming cytoskeletal protein [Prosthecobacter sp.]|jgi:cytoskeletal protein CcmA (bactofilin family)|uniref:bactofilin family protein n=1 Tax=Prosthecobacter sp. TaxID=1965333 RepID=UPI0019E8635F|nr:polymer-forming cytoskeletal protein [Prosthecobacter sp.]MBE2287037.1 polymer-forming cytoskeletal protein [Prosthecobacter sp.]